MGLNKQNVEGLDSQQSYNNILLSNKTIVSNTVLNIISNEQYSQNYIIGQKLLENKLNLYQELGNNELNSIGEIIQKILTYRPEFLEKVYGKDGSLIEQEPTSDLISSAIKELKNNKEVQIKYYNDTIEALDLAFKNSSVLKVADNPAWFSLKTKNYNTHGNNIHGNNTHGNKPKLSNYKSYTTIPIDGYYFIHKIGQLGLQLDELARKTQDKISLKVPMNYTAFCVHSDSLVIHYKNIENKDEIEKIINDWRKNNPIYGKEIPEEKRNLGRTKFAVDSEDKSFSQLVSENITNWLGEQYRTHKYNNEMLSKLAIAYAIQQSQVLPYSNN